MFRTLLQPRVSALLALFGYGGWAAYVNRTTELITSIKAFLVQGGFAFAATLSLSLLALRLFTLLGANRSALAGTFLLCFGLLATIPSCLHWLAGTPAILPAILPGLIWGSFYLAGLLTNNYRTHANRTVCTDESA